VANIDSLAAGNGLLADGMTEVLAQSLGNDALLLQTVQHLIQRGQTVYAVDAGSANAVSFTASPAAPEYPPGMSFRVRKAGAANTGAVTVNGSPLTWPDGGALEAGDWPAAGLAEIVKTSAGWVAMSIMGPSVFARKSYVDGQTPKGQHWPALSRPFRSPRT
jgi:hypothetical protein